MHTVLKLTFRLITVSIQIPFFGNKSSIVCFVRAEKHTFSLYKLF